MMDVFPGPMELKLRLKAAPPYLLNPSLPPSLHASLPSTLLPSIPQPAIYLTHPSTTQKNTNKNMKHHAKTTW